jgi:DedD protein
MFKPRQTFSAVTATPPAIEVVRQRAKHRLIGAGLLVLAGVMVFPMVFDTQPRPIPVDISIEIPSRQGSKPAGQLAAPAAQAVVAEKSLPQSEEVFVPQTPRASKPESKSEPEPETKSETQAASKVEPVAVTATKPATDSPAPRESERAQALLEGREVTVAAVPAASAARFVVQVGAFADSALAQQVRLKLERAGLKTYTHVADTPEGKRIRVRLGPFASRSDADKAAAKAKGLGLAAAILTL